MCKLISKAFNFALKLLFEAANFQKIGTNSKVINFCTL